ncbi:MAG: LolA family protein [Mangrovibacterium sp.]
MKKLYTLIILCTFALGLKAQTADSIINNVTEQFKAFKSVQLDFDYTMLNDDMGIDESNKGDLVFKDNKYILNLKQLGLSIYNDGTNSYTYNSEANELTISSLEDAEQMMNPATLFAMYENGYDAKYLGESKLNGMDCYQLEMTPQTGNEMEFSKAIIFIGKKSNFIEQAQMYVEGGTVYTLKVKNLRTDASLDDTQFSFNQEDYPGIEVIDLR